MTNATARVEPTPCSTTVRRVFAAPRSFVFDAFTQPEILRKWWGPEGFTLTGVTIDLRVGGAYRFDKTDPDGVVHSVAGQITTYTPPAALGYTWAWLDAAGKPGIETYVAIDFTDRGASTEVILTHTGFPDAAMAERHNRGWTSTFDCFNQTR